jgi:hypothetical protein
MKNFLIISLLLVSGLSAVIFAFFYKSETTTFAQSSDESNRNCQINNSNQSNTSSNVEIDRCDFSKYKTLRVRQLKLTSFPKPKHPKEKALSGVVEVKILIDKDGNVKEACAVCDSNDLKKNTNRLKDPLFIKATEEAALKIKVDLRGQSFFGKDFFEMVVVYNFTSSNPK